MHRSVWGTWWMVSGRGQVHAIHEHYHCNRPPPHSAYARVKTYQADITTQKCRAIIRKEVKGSKVDVVLSDGAPNVGTDYAYDAFVQNELCLVSCKLAVDVLAPNGWFICKVFRSQDYTKVSNAIEPYR